MKPKKPRAKARRIARTKIAEVARLLHAEVDYLRLRSRLDIHDKNCVEGFLRSLARVLDRELSPVPKRRPARRGKR